MAANTARHGTQISKFDREPSTQITRIYYSPPFKSSSNLPRLLSSPINYFFHLFSRYTPAEKAGLERTNWFKTHGLGYLHEQSTQPQTLGYGLADSPAGLLAWIYEKLVNWSDAYPWDDDEGKSFDYVKLPPKLDPDFLQS